MRRSVTSNSGPLIHLTQAGQLPLLRQLYDAILIPPAVKAEVVDRGLEKGAADAIQIEQAITAGWIRVQETNPPKNFLETAETAGLDPAEATVLHLAKQTGTTALLDDEAARTFARALRLEVKGSIGVFIQALSEKLITQADAFDGLEHLSRIMYLNVDTYRLARREIEAQASDKKKRR
jgi:predicted nucleic acid-binding protein